MKKMTRPPRLAIWLLTIRLSAEWRDFVVGDLEEEFATRSELAARSGVSPVAARAWFWWQTIRCVAAPPPVRPNLVRIFTWTPGGRVFELSPGKFYDWQRDALGSMSSS